MLQGKQWRWLVFHTIKSKVHSKGNVNQMNEGYLRIISQAPKKVIPMAFVENLAPNVIWGTTCQSPSWSNNYWVQSHPGSLVECSPSVKILNQIFFICKLTYFLLFCNYPSPKIAWKSKYVLGFFVLVVVMEINAQSQNRWRPPCTYQTKCSPK